MKYSPLTLFNFGEVATYNDVSAPSSEFRNRGVMKKSATVSNPLAINWLDKLSLI